MGRCAGRTSKICMGFLVLLFWGAAVVMLLGASFLILTYKSYQSFFRDFYILIPCGVAVTGAAFLVVNGSCGICIINKDSRCQQGTFMYFIVVLLCLEASGAILAYLSINRMDYELNPMENAFKQYNGSDSSISVNKIQEELKCCGLNNYTDWETTSWYKHFGNFSVPKSCCNVTFTSCSENRTDSNELYQEGCFVKLHHKLTFFMTLLFWSCISVICLEVLAAVSDGVLMTQNPFQDYRILDSGTFI